VQTLVLVLDGRVVGRGGSALMSHVVYTGRALPLAWLVRPGKTGHFPAARHIAVGEQGQGRMPPGAAVVLLGDGACDGTGRPQTVHEADWRSVCRTGCPLTALWHGDTCRLDTMGACSKPGTIVDWPEVCVTRAA
jgi:hypothetical protein